MSLLLREAIGGTIRRARTERRRTLRDVSGAARVSLGYLSEVERGRKEASSELLAAICEALSIPLPDLLENVAHALRPDALAPATPSSGAATRDPRVEEALREAVEEALDAGLDAASSPTDAPAPTAASDAAPAEDGPSVRLVPLVVVGGAADPGGRGDVVCSAA